MDEEVDMPAENVQQVYGQVFHYFQFNKKSNFMIDNVYYHRKYESDFISTSKLGYISEVEVKMSRSDFRNDFK